MKPPVLTILAGSNGSGKSTLANMKKLLPLADLVVILDNSSQQGYSLVAAGHRGFMSWNEPIPEWARHLR